MNFYLSKIGFLFVIPSNLIGATLIISALLLFLKRYKSSKIFLILSFILTLLLGYSSFSNYCLLLLEERFPKHQLQIENIASQTQEPYGIIILGGSVNPYLSAKRHVVSLNDTVERLTEGVALSRRFPNAKLIFTGGSPHADFGIMQSEADIVRAFFKQIGFDDSNVIYEDKSVNTYENAYLTKALIHPQPNQKYLLITSAFHMPRSMAFFRVAGFNVEAYPVDYLLAGWVASKRPHFTLSDGIGVADVAAKEWVGLLAYWITGKIPDLYPAP